MLVDEEGGDSASGGRCPVDLQLEWVLGKMPQKEFVMERVDPVLQPLVLPPGLTVREALDRVLRLPSVASKRYLTNKVLVCLLSFVSWITLAGVQAMNKISSVAFLSSLSLSVSFCLLFSLSIITLIRSLSPILSRSISVSLFVSCVSHAPSLCVSLSSPCPQVDRSVTGLVAQQQCVGPLHTPLADVAVVALSPFGLEGAATAIGEQPIKGLVSPGAGARMAVGEALTNLVFAKVTELKVSRGVSRPKFLNS